MNRLTSANVTGGLAISNYSEEYTYDPITGNLDVKAGVDLQYNNFAHKHAVTNAGGNSYQYDANGNQTTRLIGADTFNLLYDAENRLVEVKKNSSVIATFTYDGDGKRVKSVIGNETILFVGNHYEVTDNVPTKYYFAGTSRIAMRKYTVPVSMSVEYFLSDHLGSTSITTDNAGTKVSEMRYKPWGEVRYSWTATQSTTPSYALSNSIWKLKYNRLHEVTMEQITIQIRDRRKARALKIFLNSLDYVEKVSIANLKLPSKPRTSKADFFALAGVWSRRNITVDSIRSSAWLRRT